MARSGPKTPEGKPVVRLNAVRHGVFASDPVVAGVEDPEEWRQFRELIVGDLGPAGAVEEVLAERVADCAWRMRRIAAFEAGVIAARLERVPHNFGTLEYDRPYLYSGKPLSRAQAHENARRAREFVQLLEELHALPFIEPISQECMTALQEALKALDYEEGVIESMLGAGEEDAGSAPEGSRHGRASPGSSAALRA